MMLAAWCLDTSRRTPAARTTRMVQSEMKPTRFISEVISVQFDDAPALMKKPGAPDRFDWRERTFHVGEKLKEWHDYGRRGRMAHNMRPAHLRAARRRGSWGVGRDYYRVRTTCGRVFDIYYDRAPKTAGWRHGQWILCRELEA